MMKLKESVAVRAGVWEPFERQAEGVLKGHFCHSNPILSEQPHHHHHHHIHTLTHHVEAVPSPLKTPWLSITAPGARFSQQVANSAFIPK